MLGRTPCQPVPIRGILGLGTVGHNRPETGALVARAKRVGYSRRVPVFRYQRRVRYYDTDQFHAAHHSRVYLWFEEARTELLRELGRPYQDFEAGGLFFPVRESGCRYRGLALFDALLTVAIESVEVRGASLRFAYRITAAEGPIADGFTVHACVDRAGKVVRIPEEVRRLFATCEASSSR